MKGQEFDVFKLLISAMIAIAILMILQQILGQFQNLGTSLRSNNTTTKSLWLFLWWSIKRNNYNRR